jgi:nucleoside transporter
MAQAAGTLDPAAATPADDKPFDLGVWLRLSVMMFLQFAVWGAWFTVLNLYLGKTLGFSGTQIGSVYGTMALGAIFSMTVAGQLADRVMASERLMAICHLAGAALLVLLSRMDSFGGFWWVALAYALVYNPTLALSNAIAFANIKNSTHFAWVRVFGTLGWILAGMSIDFLMPAGSADTNRPILLAAGLSAALGVFSFVLPHTPPTGRKGDGIPFVRAFKLLRDPSFGVFFAVSLLVTVALAFYYGFAGTFLDEAKVANVASVMTIGQWSELLFMLLLPFGIRFLGMKTVLAVGMAAWVLRYYLFSAAADGAHYTLLIVGVALHGVCFDFFLAAGFIHTDTKAPAAIRGSAQALFSFLVYGVGMWIGNELSGRVVDHYTAGAVKDWAKIWLVPSGAAAVVLVLFLILWRDRAGKVDDGSDEPRGFPIDPLVRDGAVAPGRSTEGVANSGGPIA